MFQSLKYLSYEHNTELHKYLVVDSDFEEIVLSNGFEGAVIEAYEKRSLNVAKNLMLEIIWSMKIYNMSLDVIIQYNKKYNTKFAQYEEAVKKYMVLI